ncbi:redox-sensitive transcriptional activator SoxR [Cocleimonas flava]|uniref:Redox-sensitive transcriptional activator SoxR n=2 Tax=Cocleimonas flava TaxID=634765 RepID=A0A4R1EXX2_9GAMM|nr:redox-sensitive transcriptional activator SoxR [Cocleimonas flava]TCJ82851.1 MerR family transcriptional regulator [Cocleimonas flava]
MTIFYVMKNDPFMSIGQIAKRTGSNVSAIRFYATENLIPFTRSPSGHRLFHRSVIRRISFILISQNLGYSLQEIKGALDSLPENRTPTKADWERLSKKFSQDIESRIKQLKELQSKLSGCIGCGCLSLKKCELYNAGDYISKNGSGARFLLGDKPDES